MGDGDLESSLFGELGQLDLPGPDPVAVGSAGIGAAICDRLAEAGATILVNCAGIYPSVPRIEASTEHWDEVIEVDLRGAFLMAQAFARCVAFLASPAASFVTRAVLVVDGGAMLP